MAVKGARLDLVLVPVQNGFGFFDKIVNHLKFVIQAGKPQVGNFVEFLQTTGQGVPNEIAGHLALETPEDDFFDVFDNFLKGLGADGALPTRPLQPGEELVPLVRCPAAILLNDQQLVGLFHTLISCEPSLA